MNVLVKICGITNFEDAKAAVEAGADYLGFIFYPPSPRSITVEDAFTVIKQLNQRFQKLPVLVGVFVNEPPQKMIETLDEVGLDLAQLSGEEPPETLAALNGQGYKALRPQSVEEAALQVRQFQVNSPADDRAPAVLVDSYHPNLRGGTGELAETAVVARLRELSPRLMLAGGLTPENIAEQIITYRPFAVDVASGVEASKGKKDHQKVRDFIQNVRNVVLEQRA